MNELKWEPLDKEKLKEIKSLFTKTYPEKEYGNLSDRISKFWIGHLEKSWNAKPEELKKMDLEYNPADPLSRVQQRTTVVTYADSISRTGEESLKTLDLFFKTWFPAIGGVHLLPACTVVEDRFNDGYFSQVERDNIHKTFGSNDFFAELMHRYFSMNDLVMGHVDIQNPIFQQYLNGDDLSGNTFFVFTEEKYQEMKKAGSFDAIFRPRPFPLFTIFRKTPEAEPFRSFSHSDRIQMAEEAILRETGIKIESQVTNLLWLFSKILNDQMLLDEDFSFIPPFIDWLTERGIDPKSIFSQSQTQEVQHYPYIFIPELTSREKLLELSGFSPEESGKIAEIFSTTNKEIFGEEIRALTTFSHVQVDVNTTSFEGLKLMISDLSWYLKKDLKMLRLDAVNYAFKRWGTSCFGLPELDQLMKIIYLSMECISPRIIPNLEVNDSLTTVLTQMSAETAAPPMMHDFHLASLLPAVFHLQKPAILKRIFSKIAEFNIPASSIRFSLSESHDGKSVRGSLDLLEFGERMILRDAVLKNGGYVKYKSIPIRQCPVSELNKFCTEVSINAEDIKPLLFKVDSGNNSVLVFKDNINEISDVFKAAPILNSEQINASSNFFFIRLIEGRDPYELCITTRDSLPDINDSGLEIKRFLAFQTLAFAVMGKNVKTIYFNDLIGLPNDYSRVKKSGELRDIKRTKVDYNNLLPLLEDPESFEGSIAAGINNLIALVDADPALFFRGNEAEMITLPEEIPVAVVHNHYEEDHSLTIVNLSDKQLTTDIPVSIAKFGQTEKFIDNFSETVFTVSDSILTVTTEPFGKLWLSREKVLILPERLR